MKYVFVIFAAILLSGCDQYQTEARPGFRSVNYSLVCIDGVTYVKHSALSVKLGKDSKIVPCN